MFMASFKRAVVSVGASERVEDVVRKYKQQTEASEEHRIVFRGRILESDKLLSHYNIDSGDLHLFPLGNDSGIHPTTGGWSLDRFPSSPRILAARARTNPEGDTIFIDHSSGRQDKRISFTSIRLSCESHPYVAGDPYAGFILYAYRKSGGDAITDWRLNGKHCKSAYLVIQNTTSADVKRYIGSAPGMIHGAVYWNVFGKGESPYLAVGEGFAFRKGNEEWNSGVFNANEGDGYHDNDRHISAAAVKCVTNIIWDWQKNSVLGKTYRVKDLL